MHPALVRHLWFPLHERLMQRPTFAYLAELERSQWLDRTALERLQLRKLKALLHTALAHSPWHAGRLRAAGLALDGDAELSLEDFRRLPTMDKTDAQAHREAMVWKSVPGGAFRYNTGGSSGQPLIFYYGRSRQAADAATRMRARRWWGIEVGEPEVFLWGAPVELNKTDRIKTFRDRLFNQLLLNAFAMSVPAMDEYLGRIQRFDPACVYGYASSLALLAQHARNRGASLNTHRLKVVCATGEPLLPEQRRLIGEVFGVPVANEYGCRDGGLVALESPAGQLLVNSETILLELLDPQGRPVAAGETGEVTLTNLCSEAQPFLRYRTGDMARASGETCRDGRGLHVVAEVVGRTTDFVVRPDGTIMHALALIYVPRAVEGVGEFKIVQWTPEHLEVSIVPNAAWRDGAREEIVRLLRLRMASPVRVEVNLVGSLPPEASGKHRYVISHVALPGNLTPRE
ncbi:phenylacetate-CoA ligase [Methylomagnum ishizawai]|uniref:Phenylacetate-CoA ligase n=1 Tax=Methylomagnum ishizawai TaxID=1760988 RepID=A0A1Y6CZI2_9GAMM|nr:phenylacetate--CoA ligase family protein [Methylomagnum ishizawai]SMF93983.1 phenylacetate-CoA ligase [Methylomagnum ishizawai]